MREEPTHAHGRRENSINVKCAKGELSSSLPTTALNQRIKDLERTTGGKQ